MAETKINLTAEALSALRAMRNAGGSLPERIAHAFDYQNALTIAHIQEAYLSFPRGGPASDIGLRVQTGRLRSAAWASPATVSGSVVNSSIGDNVVYASIHEFGGSVHHPARSGSVRLRTDRAGALLGQRVNPKLAVFASKEHKRAKEVGFQAEAYDVEMPARGMFQRGIGDRLDVYGAAASQAAMDAFAEGGSK